MISFTRGSTVFSSRSPRDRNYGGPIRFRSIDVRSVRCASTISLLDSFRAVSSHRVHRFPLLLPTSRCLRRQVKPKAFTPAPSHRSSNLVHRVVAPVIVYASRGHCLFLGLWEFCHGGRLKIHFRLGEKPGDRCNSIDIF